MDRFRNWFEAQRLDLLLRILPDDQRAVSSLLVSQASFPVMDALAENLAEILRSLAPDLIVGMPTLGLELAATFARAYSHERYVPLITSRKFWYDAPLSTRISSITSPDRTKRLYLDPSLLPLLWVAK